MLTKWFDLLKNYFTGTKLNFAYNLEEISIFYNLYKDLMKHWKSVLPTFVIDIEYEKLLDEVKKTIKEIETSVLEITT